MKTRAAGALVSRGCGICLLVLGATSLLGLPDFDSHGPALSGWTSYSPLGTNALAAASGTDMTFLDDTYFLIAHHPSRYLPSGLQILIGAAMLWWSRTIGTWLARGLDDADDANG